MLYIIYFKSINKVLISLVLVNYYAIT